MAAPPAAAPRYGTGSLADVLPSVLAGAGMPPVVGAEDRLGLRLGSRVLVVLLDGLGAQLLATHADAAPFLAGLRELPGHLDAGFPTTTATSLASLGTGQPPGRHGVLGFQVAHDGHLANLLRWGPDLPRGERFQPLPTMFEQAAAAGVAVTRVGPWALDGTGLTAAALRGGHYWGADALGERTQSVVDAFAASPGPTLVYLYEGDVDTVGHRQGPGSVAWLEQLALTDTWLQRLVERLPSGTDVVITADHGMTTVPDDHRLDVETTRPFTEGVALLTGEPRARYAHARPGAAADVLACWRDALGERASVVSRDEAAALGWFGPDADPLVLQRVGDVIAVARGQWALTARRIEPFEPLLRGMHGSLEPADLTVPLLTVSV